jgi:hypothetical protein
LIELAKHDNIILRPGLTIGAWNVNRLPEIITYLTDLGVIKRHPKIFKYINYNNFFINLLDHPKHYHVSILSDEYRKATIKKLKDFIAKYNTKYSADINPIFTQIFHELNKPFDLVSAKKFMHTTSRVDGIRNENLFDVIPEMKDVQNSVRGQ